MPGHLIEYDTWNNNRFVVINEAINSLFSPEFLKNKTLLELGAGFGDLGFKFYNKGCKVTCYEGRQENLDVLKTRHPYFKASLFDADKEKLTEKYDIILHAGLLYHILNVEASLDDCLNHTNILILETENLDSDSSLDVMVKYEGVSNKVGTSSLINSDCTDHITLVSKLYLENKFKARGFKFVLLNDKRANTDMYKYDWEVQNKNRTGLRSIYIAWK